MTIARLVVLPEYRRGDPCLQRRNVKYDLVKSLVQAKLAVPGTYKFTIADVACVSDDKGGMWRRIFKAIVADMSDLKWEERNLDDCPSVAGDACAAIPAITVSVE